MGMFDSIYFKCEDCGEKIEAQSKSGPCEMGSHDYRDVPTDVAEDANRHAPFICDCGAKYEFEVPKIVLKLIRLH